MMHTVTTRKVGNSVAISIPSEFKIETGKEYLIHKSKDGSITMVPKMKNPYLSSKKFESAADNQIFEEEGWRQMIENETK